METINRAFRSALITLLGMTMVLCLAIPLLPVRTAVAAWVPTTPMVAAGGNFSVGLRADGTVVAAGPDFPSCPDVSSWAGIVQVAAGTDHIVGLRGDGTVVAAGGNSYGQLEVGTWTDVVQVAAGGYFTLGLKANRTVVAVGKNSDGETDIGSWTDVTQIAGSCWVSAGLKSDGTVVATGLKSWGPYLGVESWSDITQIALGELIPAGLRADGTVVWADWSLVDFLESANSWTDIVQVAASTRCLFGLKADGTVVLAGQQGITDGLDTSSWSDITQIAAGNGHVVGLRADGTVSCTGCESLDWNLWAPAPPPMTPPTVDNFTADRTYAVPGEAVRLSYTVSDTAGVGLKQVELWESTVTNSDGELIWPSSYTMVQPLSGQSASGYFDIVPDWEPRFRWYGIHVVDNAGNWNDERNSNTMDPSASFKPIQIEIGLADKEWSFAIITDLHIGRGYEDYGGPGWNDGGTLGDTYYLTQRLNKVVDDILMLRKTRDIRFVAVLGDISDSGESSELEAAEQILKRLNIAPTESESGLFYVPVLGNHDLWSCTNQIPESVAQPKVFYDVFKGQFEWLRVNLGDRWEQQWSPDVTTPSYFNYSLDMEGVNFVFLDLISRQKLMRGIGDFSPQTEDWLIDELGFRNPPTVLFSHIPIAFDWTAFEVRADMLADIGLHIVASETEILANFAGHKHGYFDEDKDFYPYLPPPVQNPIFLDVNDVDLSDQLPSSLSEVGFLNFPVLLTEALMVGSNVEEGKGVVRIVQMADQGFKDGSPAGQIEGEVSARAVNPYITKAEVREPESADLFGPYCDQILAGQIRVDFEGYAFTIRVRSEHPLAYHWDFGNGKGMSYLVDDWDEKCIVPPQFYPAIPGKKYKVTLTVQACTPDGKESITESITRTITMPGQLLIQVACPVDLLVSDPDGLVIDKSSGSVPGTIYAELDFNLDGELDDVIIIRDPKDGDYLIRVIPEPGAHPEATYSLNVLANETDLLLADEVQVRDAPSGGYMMRVACEELVQVVMSELDIDPDVIHPSQGKFVTAYLELPVGHGYDLSEISISSILLNGALHPYNFPAEIGDYDNDGIPDLMVKFNRTDVQALLSLGDEVEIRITGQINGIDFEGVDTVRVIGEESVDKAAIPPIVGLGLLALFGRRAGRKRRRHSGLDKYSTTPRRYWVSYMSRFPGRVHSRYLYR